MILNNNDDNITHRTHIFIVISRSISSSQLQVSLRSGRRGGYKILRPIIARTVYNRVLFAAVKVSHIRNQSQVHERQTAHAYNIILALY